MRDNPTNNQPTGKIAVGKRSKLRFVIPIVLLLSAAIIACSSANMGHADRIDARRAIR